MPEKTSEFVRSETQYVIDGVGMAHSDLDPNDRELLHNALNEWLDKANGDGFFYVGDVRELRGEFTPPPGW